MSGRVPNPWAALVAAVVIAGGIVFGVQTLGGHLPMPQGAGGIVGMDAGLTILLFGLLAVAGLIGTVATIVQVGGEEIYFRGWLQRALDAAWGPVPALLVTALVFAALHLLGGARAPLSLVNLLLGELLFGLLAQHSGGIAASTAAHLLWNWSEQLLLGLDPNPGTGSFGALFDHDLIGAAMWGGSDEGLNASLTVTLVLAALLASLATWRRTPVTRPSA